MPGAEDMTVNRTVVNCTVETREGRDSNLRYGMVGLSLRWGQEGQQLWRDTQTRVGPARCEGSGGYPGAQGKS